MMRLMRGLVFITITIAAIVFACGCGSGGNTDATDSKNVDADVVESASAGNAASIDETVSGLDKFMGGWGTLDSPYNDCDIIFFSDEDGKLKVDAGAVPGGGYYALFEADDIRINGDTMICENGHIVFDGGERTDAVLIAKPSDSVQGDYTFRFTDSDGEPYDYDGDSYNYSKVGNTQEEFDVWINEHSGSI